MAIFLTWYRTFYEKNGGLNLVLWHAKPPALMAVFIITLIKMTTLHDRATINKWEKI